MFSDKYGLTQAVLVEKKTQTRRIITKVLPEIQELRVINNMCEYKDPYIKKWYKCNSKHQPKYKVGEIVAIAQSYKAIRDEYLDNKEFAKAETLEMGFGRSNGWNNKTLVRADMMSHHIRITDIKVERLQDIPNEDCLKEGIYHCETCYEFIKNRIEGKYSFKDCCYCFKTPRKAFASLIDKVSGKRTWESNPWVFAYEFELID